MATLRRYRSMNQSTVEAFEPLFYPKSLAIIGASSDMAKFGNNILSAIMEIGYGGKIYPINPEGGEINLNGFFMVFPIPLFH
ncbi:MAG: CoA-binding protein [Deltaproteobacteria bacterium]|nr:CoA-binding protein [Deltaproteobacteria bacterium]